jgi:hypothetical protein
MKSRIIWEELGQFNQYSDGLDNWGLRPCSGKIFFSTPQHPDQLWGPNSPLSNGYRGILLQELSSESTKLTTHLHPVLRTIQSTYYTALYSR